MKLSKAPISKKIESDEEYTRNFEQRRMLRKDVDAFTGCFINSYKYKMVPVSLINISPEGLGFEVDDKNGKLNIKDQVTVRIYFSSDNYLSLIGTIINCKSSKSKGTDRYGLQYKLEGQTLPALYHFVQYFENVIHLFQKNETRKKMAG